VSCGSEILEKGGIMQRDGVCFSAIRWNQMPSLTHDCFAVRDLSIRDRNGNFCETTGTRSGA
jgi:hypothetical protein